MTFCQFTVESNGEMTQNGDGMMVHVLFRFTVS